MAEDADHADHLTRLADAVWHVAGVADELLTAGHLQQGAEPRGSVRAAFLTSFVVTFALAYLALGFYSDHVASFHYDFIHRLVQHVGASVDCTQPKVQRE